ncbi:MAG TPA: DUF5715 family protein [Flavobacteriales bacterium]|nr:DUF5715 family protein [Flavobacteriales bacterium]
MVLSLPVLAVWFIASSGQTSAVAPAAPEPVSPKPVLTCSDYPFKHHSPKLNAKLPAYKALSRQAGVRPVKDDEALSKALSSGSIALERIEGNTHFFVAPMNHGSPYLTPKAAAALRSIAKDFNARIAETDMADARIRVTSLFRTKKDQRNLGRGNVNATRDELAPHTHGTSMDLSYMKFVDQQGEPLELKACQQVFLAETLAEVIAEHSARDPRIFATKEKQQACYHISVCR